MTKLLLHCLLSKLLLLIILLLLSIIIVPVNLTKLLYNYFNYYYVC